MVLTSTQSTILSLGLIKVVFHGKVGSGRETVTRIKSILCFNCCKVFSFTELIWPLSHFGLRLESWERCNHSVSSWFTCLVQGVAPAVVCWVGHLPNRCHSPPPGEGAGLDRITAFCSLQSRFRAGGQTGCKVPRKRGQRGRTRDTYILPKPKQSHGKERVWLALRWCDNQF